MGTINLPEPKFKEMIEKVSCKEIADQRSVRGIVRFHRETFIMTGSIGTGYGGHSSVDGYRCVLLKQYRDDLEPLEYPEHNRGIRNEKRERSYNGLIVHHKKEKWVLVGKRVEFQPTQEGKQKEIFA